MIWTPEHTTLRNTLAALFPGREETRALIEEAGIPVIHVAISDRPITNWHEAIREADQRGKLASLIQAALARYPDHPVLRDLALGRPTSSAEPALDWRGSTASAPTFEKITGLRSTILPIHFLARGLAASRAVARVVLPGHVGTGFLIAGDILVTNNHVVPSADVARAATIQFNYEKTVTGADAIVDTFELQPDDLFASSEKDDWTAVRVKPTGLRRATEEWGTLTLVEADVAVNDPVNIIQHPGGGPKQIALYHNYVAFADTRVIQYLTDTLPGSSGAPVFDENWNVVAVHHAGGFLEEPGTKSQFFRNEGIRSTVLLRGLVERGIILGT